MTYLQAIILGLAQGLSEFLPISSSGHLALLQYFFGVDAEQVLPFAVLLHLGTLISVFIVYWNDIVELVKELGAVIKDIFTGKGLRINANPTRRLGFMIIVATIPTAIIGLVFNDLFASLYLSLIAIGTGLVITGAILLIAEKMGKNNKGVKEMKFRHALFVGLMQGVAICPGISRSGSTLFGGLISGLNREFAVKFAFLISIPSILGSVIVEAPDAFKSWHVHRADRTGHRRCSRSGIVWTVCYQGNDQAGFQQETYGIYHLCMGVSYFRDRLCADVCVER